jgi:16S rRNA (guanine527-N7)-methyltransferase
MMDKKRIRPQKDKAPSEPPLEEIIQKGSLRALTAREKPLANPKTKDESEAMDPILAFGASEISVPLSGESVYAFKTYARLLREWNEKMNLTRILDDKGIALRHFVDSLTLVPFLEAEMIRQGRDSLELVDVGTGAGFPGIPLKVALPSLQITLLDSLRKRISFLEAVCGELDL